MYLDFLKENFTDINLDIDEKLKYINSIKLEESKLELFIEEYDTTQPYISKKNISSMLPECNGNDMLIITPSSTICNSTPINLYLNYGENFHIEVLPDGYLPGRKACNNNEQFISKCNYNALIKQVKNQPIQIVRETYFNFPDSPIRQFNYSNLNDKSIINYFNNYTKYTNYINSTSNPLLSSFCIDNLSCNSNDMSIINNYFSIIQNLLLLKNTSDITYNSFTYNSGYSFDINTIKTNVIDLYSNLPNIPANSIMYIDDKTSIKFLQDSNKNVYTMELNPSVTIIFKNLSLGFNQTELDTSGINNSASIWNLNYLNSLSPSETDVMYTYTYKPNPIYFPIVLPFLIPTPTTTSTIWNTVNTNKNTDSILTYISKLSPSIADKLSEAESNINSVINTLTTKDGSSLLSIIDIFLLYDSESNLFQSFIVTNEESIDSKYMLYPVLNFSTTYTPTKCKNGTLYNDKCLANCPSEFTYDLGEVCLNSNQNLYIPNSSICDYLNSHMSNINPTLQRLIDKCNPNVTPEIETFSNYQKSNITHYSPFLE